MSKIDINIKSEVDTLKKVLLHTPGNEMSYLGRHFTQEFEYDFNDNTFGKDKDFLLWDDMIYLPRAIREHKELCKIINILSGQNACIQFKDLFLEILDNKDIRNELMNEIYNNTTYNEDSPVKPTSAVKGLVKSFERIKDEISLYEALVSGQVPTGETVTTVGGYEGQTIFNAFKPIVNLLFTRDLAFSFGNTTVISWNSKEVRNRENILIKNLFKYHPSLNQNKLIFFHDKFPDLTIEGGDVMVFNSKTILVGLSERTKKESVEALLPHFLDEGFNNVIGISLEKKRSFMHLDTVLTKIDEHEYLLYEPSSYGIECFEFNKSNPSGKKLDSKLQLGDLICDLDNKAETFWCGYNEQWTCGANALAVRPGKILLYERNKNTITRLAKGGYKAYNPEEIISGDFDENEKLVVKINGSELSKGRGGARCMTMPLVRG